MITLKSIIDEFMLEASDPDSYASGVNRTIVLKHAKRSLEDINYASQPMLRLVRQELPEHKTLEWPVGAIDIIRMQIVDTDGYLTPIYVNERNPIAFEYVKDSEGDLIVDGTTGLPIKASVDPEYPIRNVESLNDPDAHQYSFLYGRRYGLRGGEVGRAGTYRFERETKRIYFESLDAGTNIYFEYIINPLLEKPEDLLEVHEYMRKPMMSAIYYGIIEKKRNVPMGEKERARREYYHDLKQTKKRTLINPQEIAQAFKKQRAFLSW